MKTRQQGDVLVRPDGSKRTAIHTYRSKLEALFADELEREQMAGLIRRWDYEPFSFRLRNGKRYQVDFMVWYRDGTLSCFEVTGCHSNNKRSAVTHLAWAAQRFPMFNWLLVWRKDGQWQSKSIGFHDRRKAAGCCVDCAWKRIAYQKK